MDGGPGWQGRECFARESYVMCRFQHTNRTTETAAGSGGQPAVPAARGVAAHAARGVAAHAGRRRGGGRLEGGDCEWLCIFKSAEARRDLWQALPAAE